MKTSFESAGWGSGQFFGMAIFDDHEEKLVARQGSSLEEIAGKAQEQGKSVCAVEQCGLTVVAGLTGDGEKSEIDVECKLEGDTCGVNNNVLAVAKAFVDVTERAKALGIADKTITGFENMLND